MRSCFAVALLAALPALACGRSLVGDARAPADAAPMRPGCLAQLAGVYDSVFVARRTDGSIWAAPDHTRFDEIRTADGARFVATDLVAAGSSAYGTAVGCARVAGGAVWCVPIAGPLIHSGDLGAGLGADVTTTGPTQVRTSTTTLAGARQLTASLNGAGARFCAVTDDGGLACWGYGADDVLGRGDDSDATFARPVLTRAGAPLAGVVEAQLGEHAACARTNDGTVSCWGDNHLGELGVAPDELDGDPSPRPVALPAPATRLATSPGDTFCAILADDRVACWGSNNYAQAGAADTQTTVTPTIVLEAAGGAPLRGARDLAPDRGMQGMCANTTTRGLVCWGHLFPAPGQTVDESPFPVDVPRAGPAVVHAPLAAYGGRDGALMWIDGDGKMAIGAGAAAAAVQPPCEP
ncbi:MAG TPA: hypothetical protein VHJ20_14125 [Polyangia bacterium]|nr:hypothetical protein [Polyangia bacterium]